ncbi:MAG: transcriptional regulator [Microbacterium sp.]|jgi:AcrR family transcriptional regulator|nr:transcriptional regulator [Microbacterium sp.]
MTETTRTARKPRGEYAKSEATRQAILDAALEVFAESGFRAGSLREIAQRVGMSEAGLLHHFPRKSALLLAVLDHRDEAARAVVDFDLTDGAATLHGLVELAALNASMPGVVELFCTLSAEATSPTHPAHEYFQRRYAYVRGRVADAFQRLAEAGRLFEGVDVQRSAVVTIAIMDGLQVQWLLDPDSTDMAEELAAHFRLLVRGFDLAALENVLDLRAGETS